QAAVVDARLHPADVVAHDEEDVGLLLLLRSCWQIRRHTDGDECKQSGPKLSHEIHGNLLTFRVRGKVRTKQPHRGLLYCRGHQSSRVTADSNGAGPVSAMQMHKARTSVSPPVRVNGRADLVVPAVVSGCQYNLTSLQSADDVFFRSQSCKF